MLQEAIYAVPPQILFKCWHAPSALSDTAGEMQRRLLLRNPSHEDTQMLLLVPPPSTSFFRVDTPGVDPLTLLARPAPNGNLNGDQQQQDESNYFVTGGEPYRGMCYQLPPQATLTCTVMFHACAAASTAAKSASSSASSPAPSDARNHQDALFVYSPSCTTAPLLCIPLLALSSDVATSATVFVPPSLTPPANPPTQFWIDWIEHRRREEEEERHTREAQEQTYVEGRGGEKPDVFTLGEEDEDEDMCGANDDDDDQKRMGAAIAAAAAAAVDDDDTDMVGGRRTPPHPSSLPSRSGLTTAGVLRTGLAARLHSSHGGRSGRPITPANAANGGQSIIPGTVHVFAPYQRPATAEQRHLADRVDSSFIHRTEQEIDDLVEEELDEIDQLEERMLIESATRPSTAATRMTQPKPQPVQPASLTFTQENEEQDEQEFYKQILLTARSCASPAVPSSSDSGSLVDGTPSRVGRVGSGRRAHPGIPRSSPPPPPAASSVESNPHQSPRYSPEPNARRTHSGATAGATPEQQRARPASRPNGQANDAGINSMMRQLSFDGRISSSPDGSSGRVGRVDDADRRRYLDSHSSPHHQQQPHQHSHPQLHRPNSNSRVRDSGTRPDTASNGLKLPKIV